MAGGALSTTGGTAWWRVGSGSLPITDPEPDAVTTHSQLRPGIWCNEQKELGLDCLINQSIKGWNRVTGVTYVVDRLSWFSDSQVAYSVAEAVGSKTYLFYCLLASHECAILKS